MKAKILVLLGLIACLLIVVIFTREATQDSNTASPADTEIEDGETQEISGLAIRLNNVTVSEHNENEQIVKVDVTVENERDTSVNFSPVNFTLMDEDHYAYTHASGVDTKGILGGQLAAGRMTSGEVAYIVPIGDQFEFIYTDHFRSGQLVFPIDLTH